MSNQTPTQHSTMSAHQPNSREPCPSEVSQYTTSSRQDSFIIEVPIMLLVKKHMEMIPTIRQTPEYFNILKGVHKYLQKHCNHNIVHDLIDIDPDRSCAISYCTICGNTV